MSLRSKIITYTDGGGLFWLLVSTIVLVALFYIYSVNQTIVMVAERNSIESKISAHRTSITRLESAYIAKKNEITMELAQSLGYSEAKQIVYISKKSVSVLSRANTIQ